MIGRSSATRRKPSDSRKSATTELTAYGKPRCQAHVPVPPYKLGTPPSEYRQCDLPAATGRGLCGTHQKVRDRMDVPPRSPGYYVTLHHKPAPRNGKGGYKNTVIGRRFETYDDAWNYARLMGTRLYRSNKPGRRVSSVSVERGR